MLSILTALVASQTMATPISFPDGNFESEAAATIFAIDGQTNTDVIAGWTVEVHSDVTGGMIQAGTLDADSNKFGTFGHTLSNVPMTASLTSPELDTFLPNKKYTIRWNTKAALVWWQNYQVQSGDFGVKILNGSDGTVASFSRASYMAQVNPNDPGWQPVVFTFTTGATAPVGKLRIRAFLLSKFQKSFAFSVDDFTVDVVEPDPVVVPPPPAPPAPKLSVIGGTTVKVAASKASIKLKGKSTGNVTRVEYRIVQGLKAGKAIRLANGSTSWSFSAKLRKGKSVYEIRAVGPGGASAWKRVTVKR